MVLEREKNAVRELVNYEKFINIDIGRLWLKESDKCCEHVELQKAVHRPPIINAKTA